jgi:Mn2+/Fe2+ NRAMP family transporter
VLVGFPLGAVLSLSIAACAAIVLLPKGIAVESLFETALPIAQAFGKIGLIIAILGFVAATFGASLEVTLSSGYTLAQFFGWPWGKFRRPAHASRFHAAMILSLVVALGILFTGVDPVQVTEISVVFSAIALPLTYLPILIVANDPKYMGEHVNGKATNAFGLVFLGIILVASIAAIPLMIVTGAGA